MSDLLRYGSGISWIVLVMWLWTPSARAQSPVQSALPQSSAPHSSEDLSARATDPTAALMSFGFINDFHTSFHDLDDHGFEFGYDGGDAVSREYKPKFPFTGGQVIKVVFDVAKEAYIDVEQELAAALARD